MLLHAPPEPGAQGRAASLSSRCFVCRQSRQQLEEEQKRSLYGLESSGKVSRAAPCPRCVLGEQVPELAHSPAPRPSLAAPGGVPFKASSHGGQPSARLKGRAEVWEADV